MTMLAQIVAFGLFPRWNLYTDSRQLAQGACEVHDITLQLQSPPHSFPQNLILLFSDPDGDFMWCNATKPKASAFY